MSAFTGLFGGVLIYAVTVFASYLGPKQAAILSTVPIIDLFSLLGIATARTRISFVTNAIKSNLIIVGMYCIISIFQSSSQSVYISVMLGFVSWLLGSFLMYLIE